MRQGMLMLLVTGLVFALVGIAPSSAAPEKGKTDEKPAAKTEGEKTATATTGEKVAAKTVSEKSAAKTNGEKPPEKTGGEKAAPAGKPAIRVDCGASAEYTDEAGNKWLADQEWAEGKKWGAVGGGVVARRLSRIEGTQAPGVFLTERYGMTGYRFELPKGRYTVRLHFAETYGAIRGAGQRVFTVKIQGKPVFENVDPFKDGGGFARPVVKEAKGIEVADGNLAIEFVEITQAPEINGIEIVAE